MAFADQALSLPAPDSRTFRDALGRFATGVAFITAAVDGEPTGLIVDSLTSVSLNPPLVAFTPARASLTWGRMRRTGRFGVNVLGMQHEGFAKRVAPAGADHFADIDWVLGPGGAPLLTDALATLECEIVAEHPAGVSVDGLDIAAARFNPTGTLDTSFGSGGRTTIPGGFIEIAYAVALQRDGRRRRGRTSSHAISRSSEGRLDPLPGPSSPPTSAGEGTLMTSNRSSQVRGVSRPSVRRPGRLLQRRDGQPWRLARPRIASQITMRTPIISAGTLLAALLASLAFATSPASGAEAEFSNATPITIPDHGKAT